MCFEKIDFAKSKMWPNLKSLILSNILVLVAGIEIAKSSAVSYTYFLVSDSVIVCLWQIDKPMIRSTAHLRRHFSHDFLKTDK